MKYLSVQACELLQKLGVKCETGKYWWWDAFGLASSKVESLRLEYAEPRNPQGGWKYCPAYSLPLLITDSEAMKAIFWRS